MATLTQSEQLDPLFRGNQAPGPADPALSDALQISAEIEARDLGLGPPPTPPVIRMSKFRDEVIQGPEPIQAIATKPTNNNTDLRIRLRAQTAAQQQVYGTKGENNILNILYDTNGMLFPYTPVIAYSQAVDYRAMEMVHTNQDFYVYGRTPSLELTVTGEFTVQNYREGQYALACIHFLRTVSKMYFGEKSALVTMGEGRRGQEVPSGGRAGIPPPVLLFSGYGKYMFNDLRVIVKNHSITLDKTMDYVTVMTAGGVARLPAMFTIAVQLLVQNTPGRQRKDFDLDDFREGKLMRAGNSGWI